MASDEEKRRRSGPSACASALSELSKGQLIDLHIDKIDACLELEREVARLTAELEFDHAAHYASGRQAGHGEAADTYRALGDLSPMPSAQSFEHILTALRDGGEHGE